MNIAHESIQVCLVLCKSSAPEKYGRAPCFKNPDDNPFCKVWIPFFLLFELSCSNLAAARVQFQYNGLSERST